MRGPERPEWCNKIECPFALGPCNIARVVSDNYRNKKRKMVMQGYENLSQISPADVIRICETKWLKRR